MVIGVRIPAPQFNPSDGYPRSPLSYCPRTRVLGFPIYSPQAVVDRILGDLDSIARLARSAPAQLDRMLELGEEIASLGRDLVDLAQRLDRRAQAIESLGGRLESRATALLELGGQLNDLGARIDDRGADIVDRATRVVETGSELLAVLPALDRALEMATPLEGAINRMGALVDRLPGGPASRRRPWTD